MNSSSNSDIEFGSRTQIVSDELFPYLNTLAWASILIFSVPAVCFNTINVIIFCKIGVTDSITVCFLYLAVCDFCSMVLTSLSGFFRVMFLFGVPGSENFRTYSFNAGAVYVLPQSLAAAATTFIALQRGLSVACPFLTRNIFTRKRSIIVLTALSLILFACWVPRVTAYRNVYVPNPTTNSSQILVVHYLDIWRLLDSFYNIFVQIFLLFVQYIIMSICAVAIAIGMRSSMKLKSTSTLAGSVSLSNRYDSQNLENTGQIENVQNNFMDSRIQSSKQSQKMSVPKSSKEMQVIKQAFIVVLLNVICTTPAIPTLIYNVMEPKFQLGSDYHNFFFVVIGFVRMSPNSQLSAPSSQLPTPSFLLLALSSHLPALGLLALSPRLPAFGLLALSSQLPAFGLLALSSQLPAFCS
ncbi:chemosensory receptor c [Plakobranchus ocellatus]|uniref:Chemosensory receptor c n=1 Tax=Plakobranchus ocellatus TaxID=259542 RepID=A0AAV3YS42_9GAST|nr:chemosensory receptor c [Plakobranchus ocellatus]